MSAVLRSAATGLLGTTATASTWTHRLGADAPLPFSSLRIRLTTVDPRIVLGTGDATVRRYDTPATSLVPEVLGSRSAADMTALGRAWGEALRSVHGAVVETEAVAPRPLLRAAAWLDGGWSLADELRDPLAAWALRMRAPARPVVLHGHPGMAHWVVDGLDGVLLTGEDLGVGDPVYDVAWVLGEIAELDAFYPALRPALDALRGGFLGGYGIALDPAELRVGVAFRLAQHAYDWQHYAGASPAAARLLLRVAADRLRDDDGRRAA